MRGVVVALMASACATGSSTVTRALLVPTMQAPMAASAPSQFWSGGVVLNAMPFGAGQGAAQEASGDQAAVVEPELGMVFRLVKHLLIGGKVYFSSGDWGVRTRADQAPLSGQAMAGGRVRMGFAWSGESGLGVIASLEPGLDFMPLAATGSGYGMGIFWLPELGGSAALTYERESVRFYAGLGATTLPVITSQVTIREPCFSGCTSTGDSTAVVVAATAGIRVKVTDSVFVALTVTQPLTRDDLAWTPIFALSLQADIARAEPAEPDGPQEPPHLPPGPPGPEWPAVPLPL
jgi:hypothetical protein